MVGIYKVTSPTGKVYIGQSWEVEGRLNCYRKGKCHKGRIKNSLISHGPENHTYEIVHVLPSDVKQEVLDIYEQLYMDRYRDCGIELLNIRGGGSRGRLAETTKEKMSITKKGKPVYKKRGVSVPRTKESIEKQRKTITGRTRPKHSETLTGRKCFMKDGVSVCVLQSEVEQYLKDGWIPGRIIRNKNKK
jgi:group I intron endonuclease